MTIHPIPRCSSHDADCLYCRGYYVSLVEHEALKRRVVLLENRLNVPNPPSAGSAQPMEHSPSKSGQSPIRYTDVGSSPGQASLDEATEELDAALLLDTLALGSKTGRQQFVYDQQHRSNGSHLNRRSRDGSTGQPTRVTGPLSFFLGLNFDYLAAASAALPSSEVQQRLIQHYRDNVDWQLRVSRLYTSRLPAIHPRLCHFSIYRPWTSRCFSTI